MEFGLEPRTFSPFCIVNTLTDPVEFAKKCLDCSFAVEAGVRTQTNSFVYQFCNRDVHEYPLPLYKCGLCNGPLIVASLIFILAISVVTVSVNLWSVFVWFNSKKKRPQIFFKLSLVFSDLLFGAVVLPEAAYHLINAMLVGHEEYYAFYKLTSLKIHPGIYRRDWEAFYSPSNIRVSAALLIISQGASLGSILLISVDRHVAVVRNIHYGRLMTKTKSLLMIFAMWSVVVTVAVTCTLFLSKFTLNPYGMFLPIAESYKDDEARKSNMAFLVPMVVIFAVTVAVTASTSYKLRTASVRIRYLPKRKSNFSIFSMTDVSKSNKRLSLTTSNCIITINDQLSSDLSDQSASSSTRTGVDERRNTIPSNFLKVPAEKHVASSTNLGYAYAAISSNEVNLSLRSNDTNIASRISFCDTASFAGSDEPLTKETGTRLEREKFTAEDKSDRENQVSRNLGNSFLSLQSRRTSSASSNVQQKIKMDWQNDHRMANKTLMLILLIYTLCVMPITVLLAIYLFDDSIKYSNDKSVTSFESVSVGFMVTICIFVTSSVWNVVIYSTRNLDYKKSSSELRRKLNGKFRSIFQV
ncbi:uncharacterized protein LOC143468697 [Clavelina lepadiformis]|uniref:uncharacterized protein LOC143468697 n=1 Tax=Clavelina lepadiformis TaxID=159417 RepID=UPI0040427287